MMVRSFLRLLCIVSGVIGAPNIASALPPMAQVRTASVSHDLFFLVELSIFLREGDDIEPGIVHPEAMKLFAADMFLSWLGAFGYAELGKGGGEGFAGVVFRPSLGDSITLDIGLGGGLGVGGVPIPGWYIQFEEEQRVFLSTIGSYHYVTGWSQEFQFRFRPAPQWIVEPWIGMFASVAGKDDVSDSLEAGPQLAALVRWPVHTLLSFGWPIRRVDGNLLASFRLALTFQFPARF